MSITVAERLLCELRKWIGRPGEYTRGDTDVYFGLLQEFVAHYGLGCQG